MSKNFLTGLGAAAVLATGVSLLFSNAALSQVTITNCLSVPHASCMDDVNARLIDLERRQTDPDAQARLIHARAQTLSYLGQFAYAERAIDLMPDNATGKSLADEIRISLVSDLAQKGHLDDARRLLSEIELPQAYERARAMLVTRIVQAGDIDAALATASDTDRSGAPLSHPGVIHLATGLAAEGRLSDALQLVASAVPQEQQDMLLDAVVKRLVETGQHSEANTVIAQMTNSVWRIAAIGELAASYADADQHTLAAAAFDRSQGELAGLADIEKRQTAFDYLAKSAISAGYADWAVNAAQAVSISPLEHARAVRTVGYLQSQQPRDQDWRSIFSRALTILGDRPTDSASAALERYDAELAGIGLAIGMAGDIDWAIETIKQVSDSERRSEMLYMLGQNILDQNRFVDSLAVLKQVDCIDQKVRGLVFLAQTALDKGQRAYIEKVMNLVLGLVEGPFFIPADNQAVCEVNDYTVTKLAMLEARLGLFDVAEMRAAHMSDENLRSQILLEVLKQSGLTGTPEQYSAALAKASAFEAQLDGPQQYFLWQYAMQSALVMAGKIEDAFALHADIPNHEIRDKLFAQLSDGLANTGDLVSALRAADLIEDTTLSTHAEHRILVTLLNKSLKS